MSKAKKTADVTPTYELAFGAVLWGFVAAGIETASRSASGMSTLAEMASTLTPAQFDRELARLFGNGERGKARVAGCLIAALVQRAETEKVNVPPSVRVYASQVRKVGASIGKVDMLEVMQRGTRAAYDYANGTHDAKGEKIVATTTEKKATPEPLAVASTESVLLAMCGTKEGRAHVLAVMVSALIAEKDTIRAAAVQDVRTKLAA